MSDKKLAILGVVAAVLAVLAVVLSRVSNNQNTGSMKNTLLIQGLDTSRISEIQLGSGDKKVTLKRTGKGFVVVNKDNYPASMKKINNLINMCLDIKVIEKVTSNPKNQAALEVTEDKGQNVVKFLDNKGKLITGLIVGKRAPTGGAYVRLVNSNDVYLAPDPGWLQMAAMSYIDKELYKTKPGNIAEVEVLRPDGDYTIKADKNGNAVLENIPKGKQLKGTTYQQVFNAITDLEFNDVKKESAQTAKLNFNKRYICKLKDSTVITLKIAEDKGKVYVKCQAKFTGKGGVEVSKSDSKAALKKKEKKLLAEKNALVFNNTHKGWVYEIVSWQADNLNKKLSDLIEDKPKPKPKVEPKAKPKSKVKSKSKAQSNTRHSGKPNVKAKPKSEPKPKPKTKADVVPKRKANTGTNPKLQNVKQRKG